MGRKAKGAFACCTDVAVVEPPACRVVALFGLYFTVGLGAMVLFSLVTSTSNDPINTDRLCKYGFAFTLVAFALGLGGIFVLLILLSA
jgi:hypothetical protein